MTKACQFTKIKCTPMKRAPRAKTERKKKVKKTKKDTTSEKNIKRKFEKENKKDKWKTKTNMAGKMWKTKQKFRYLKNRTNTAMSENEKPF